MSVKKRYKFGKIKKIVVVVSSSASTTTVITIILHASAILKPVLHDWFNKGRGMYYPVCGMVHIK